MLASRRAPVMWHIAHALPASAGDANHGEVMDIANIAPAILLPDHQTQQWLGYCRALHRIHEEMGLILCMLQ